MKKVSFLFLSLCLTILVSCSKDAKINRRIEGDWKVVSWGGETLLPGETLVFSFKKDNKKDGSGTMTFTSPTEGVFAYPFTYSVENSKITMNIDSDVLVLDVKKYEKDHLEFLEVSEGGTWILEPK